ncbi:MAG TPA: phosphate acyltransferase PlsX [Kofleriaceae bacterium]|nr:phosphate acyltransferase PlsX [Kofleriaceae bacterium]
MTRIAMDAMGGDNAPGPEVAGARLAAEAGVAEVVLVGDQERIERALGSARRSPRLSVRHASEVVTMEDNPGQAYRKKRDSSLRVAFELCKAGKVDAVVSAGNSGAVLSHGLFVLGRLPGVERPGIVAVFPTPNGATLTLCDMGANVEVKATMLAQFGLFAACFAQVVGGKARPRLGLLSNGAESHKGTELTRAADALLCSAAEHPDAAFEYLGYVEGSELFRGHIDAVCTDGFTGNIVLKLSEGVSEAVMRMIKRRLESSPRAKLGGLLAKPALLSLKREIDYAEIGGAPLVGLRGLAVICHGRSDPLAIKNGIAAAARLSEAGLLPRLGDAVARHGRLWEGPGSSSKEEGPRAERDQSPSDGAHHSKESA